MYYMSQNVLALLEVAQPYSLWFSRFYADMWQLEMLTYRDLFSMHVKFVSVNWFSLRHKVFTWTYVHLSSVVKASVIQLTAISQGFIPLESITITITKINLEITYLELHSNLSYPLHDACPEYIYIYIYVEREAVLDDIEPIFHDNIQIGRCDFTVCRELFAYTPWRSIPSDVAYNIRAAATDKGIISSPSEAKRSILVVLHHHASSCRSCWNITHHTQKI